MLVQKDDDLFYRREVRPSGETKDTILGFDHGTVGEYNFIMELINHELDPSERLIDLVTRANIGGVFMVDHNSLNGNDGVTPIEILRVEYRGDSGRLFDVYYKNRNTGESDMKQSAYYMFTAHQTFRFNTAPIPILFNTLVKKADEFKLKSEFAKELFSGLDLTKLKSEE